MARRPEVFVQTLTMEEGRKLQRITRTAKNPIKQRRAIVVMMSGQGQTVPDITPRCSKPATTTYAELSTPSTSGGSTRWTQNGAGITPPVISQATREHICLIARTTPTEWGIKAFSTWSLKTLAQHLVSRKVVTTISREHLRRILKNGGVSWQTTTAWKSSTDPDFIAKMWRVLELYDHPPTRRRQGGVRHEFGPLNPMPRKGKRRRLRSHPARLCATYRQDQGVRYMIAALDLATGQIYYRIGTRKRWQEFLSFLKTLCRRWPGEKLCVIVDNFSPHRHAQV